jgi:hypothetical protein
MVIDSLEGGVKGQETFDTPQTSLYIPYTVYCNMLKGIIDYL